MHSAAMYAKSTQSRNQHSATPTPSYSNNSSVSNPTSANVFPGASDPASNNSLGYQDGSAQSFTDNSDSSFYKGHEAVPTPSYRHAKVNPAVTMATNFYVATNTLVQVSSGDDQWSSGYWRDNHRAVNVLESSLHPASANGVLFVRLADVALNDTEGRAMYLASNRQRPCYIAFAMDAVLYYSADELAGPKGANKKSNDASNFEAVDVAALHQHLCQQRH